MKIEINEQFIPQNITIQVGKHEFMFSPLVEEDYYLFRVHLFKDQYLLAFPKFGTIGIGFAQEEDWNCNLPYTCEAEEIYKHIKHNKEYKEIKKCEVIHAIELLQAASVVYMLLANNKYEV